MKWKTRGIHRLWDDRGKELRQKSLPTVSTRNSCYIDGTASDAVNTKPTDTVYHQGQNNKPLLGEADWNNSAWRRSIWTMSFDGTQAPRPTGFLVDVSTANSRRPRHNGRGSHFYLRRRSNCVVTSRLWAMTTYSLSFLTPVSAL